MGEIKKSSDRPEEEKRTLDDNDNIDGTKSHKIARLSNESVIEPPDDELDDSWKVIIQELDLFLAKQKGKIEKLQKENRALNNVITELRADLKSKDLILSSIEEDTIAKINDNRLNYQNNYIILSDVAADRHEENSDEAKLDDFDEILSATKPNMSD